MALTVRDCCVCGTPMTTQRASKKTCSNRCYMQMHRAAKRKLINLDTINPPERKEEQQDDIN
ncbi:hypothetical protein D3C87_1142090 [compost metagenome]